jgi:plasmid stabilization system protein ParE
MPQGEKSTYTGKQKRKAEHIEESYEARGVSKKEAEERAWRTVNKQDKGGKNPGGSGRAKKSSSSKGGAKSSSKKASGKKKSSRKK